MGGNLETEAPLPGSSCVDSCYNEQNSIRPYPGYFGFVFLHSGRKRRCIILAFIYVSAGNAQAEQLDY